MEKKTEYRRLFTEAEIRARIRDLARRIETDYRGKMPILVGVLNGAFIFMADLVRELEMDCEVDFIKVSSYDNRRVSSGNIQLLKDVDAHVAGRDVLVVEDIVDSGRSVNYIRDRIESLNPESLRVVTLFYKEGKTAVPLEVAYVGFRIPNVFVVGYGLDFAQRFRNLRGVFAMDDATPDKTD